MKPLSIAHLVWLCLDHSHQWCWLALRGLLPWRERPASWPQDPNRGPYNRFEEPWDVGCLFLVSRGEKNNRKSYVENSPSSPVAGEWGWALYGTLSWVAFLRMTVRGGELGGDSSVNSRRVSRGIRRDFYCVTDNWIKYTSVTRYSEDLSTLISAEGYHLTSEGCCSICIPANTKHLYNICTMLDQRRRRWADVVQMLYKCFVFAGMHQYKQLVYELFHHILVEAL